ncbi:MAG: cytochrome c peroxidase [Phycisphaerales bacterium]|nr:cytochrome c peroxidase [Phycisphaerales bacterium]
MTSSRLAIAACGLLFLPAAADELPESSRRTAIAANSLTPPPPNPTNRVADEPAARQLGQALFFDPNLSSNGQISCATCHDPSKAFTDERTIAKGLKAGVVNTPTLLGAAHQRWLFHDGRADTLWSQALTPLESDLEMGSTRTDVARYIASNASLNRAYVAIFGPLPDMGDEKRFPAGAKPDTPQWETMTSKDQHDVTEVFVNIGKAIEAYERQLVPGESAFDKWASSLAAGERDDTLMSDAALRGFTLFTNDAGCTQCHFGPMISDLEFHDLSLPSSTQTETPLPGRGSGYPTLRNSEFRADGPWSDAPKSTLARRAASARIGTEHWGAVRTPSLRNVAATAPYMHSGQFETLSDVLAFYNTLEGQVRRHHHAEAVLVPLNLTDQQLSDLEAFLRTLTGTLPPKTLSIPPVGYSIPLR